MREEKRGRRWARRRAVKCAALSLVCASRATTTSARGRSRSSARSSAPAAPSAAKKVDDTAEIILKRLHRGDTFGETALNQDAGVRTASALVRTSIRALCA